MLLTGPTRAFRHCRVDFDVIPSPFCRIDHCQPRAARGKRCTTRTQRLMDAQSEHVPPRASAAAGASYAAAASRPSHHQPAAATATSAGAASVPASWMRPYTPGPLTEAEFEHYWEQGYVIKQGLLTQDDINPCLEAIERCD